MDRQRYSPEFKDEAVRQIVERGHAAAIIVILLGCVGLVIVIVLDKLFWRTGILAEGWPNFSLGYLIRSIIIFISMLAIFLGLIGRNRPKLILIENNRAPIEQLSILGVLFFSILFLFIFIFEPSIFNTLSREDGPIEWGSAVLLFSSFIIFVISSLKCRNNPGIPKTSQWSITILAFVFFVIAMEEVSWFQRIIEFETPKAFDGNWQKEINLHNFATGHIENIYYIGAFLFLVVLPFMRLLFSCLSSNNYLRTLVPRPFIGVIGATACAYNYDMWNIIFTQIAFFSSMVILLSFAVFSSIKNERSIILFAIILMVATQVLFLSNGSNFSRLWEVTEYKEFFIPLGFFIYSLDVYIHLNQGLKGSVTNAN